MSGRRRPDASRRAVPLRLRVLLAALLASTATSLADAAGPRDEAELAGVVGTRRPGTPVDCISPQNQTSVQVVEGTAIVYGYGTRLYVNRPVTGAETLHTNDVLVAHIYRQQLCRLDTVTLFSPSSHIPRGVVTLGPFIPYSRPRSPAREAGR